MPLPKVVTPTYNITLPCSGKKVKIRPFLVMEEKLLMMAMQTEDNVQIGQALSETVKNCTFGKIDPNKVGIELGDIEYIFLQVRAKAKGEISEFTLRCRTKECEGKVGVKLDLSTVEVSKSDVPNTYQVPGTELVLTFRYPTFQESMELQSIDSMEQVLGLFAKFTESIIEGDMIHKLSDYTDDEQTAFIESLDTQSFEHFQNFLKAVPRVTKDLSIKCVECKETHVYELRGIESFFR